MLLQVVILLTGNYGFFNWLTLALCLLLLDDALLRKISSWPGSWRRRVKVQPNELAVASEQTAAVTIAQPLANMPPSAGSGAGQSRQWPLWITAPLAAVILLVTSTQWLEILRLWNPPPGALLAVQRWVSPFCSVNTYGLFAVIATSRAEIEIVEGSNDGKDLAAVWVQIQAG